MGPINSLGIGLIRPTDDSRKSVFFFLSVANALQLEQPMAKWRSYQWQTNVCYNNFLGLSDMYRLCYTINIDFTIVWLYNREVPVLLQ